MKKLILIICSLLGAFIIIEKDIVIQANQTIFSNTKSLEQQRQEFFQKLSKKYYGIPDYAKELEFVNRTLPVENIKAIDNSEIIIPAITAISRLRYKHFMASANNDPVGESKIIKSDRYKLKDIKQKLAKDWYFKGSISFIMIAAFLLSFLISLASYIMHKFKTKRTQPFINIDDEPIIYDDRILLDFDITSFEENSLIS